MQDTYHLPFVAKRYKSHGTAPWKFGLSIKQFSGNESLNEMDNRLTSSANFVPLEKSKDLYNSEIPN